LPSSPTGASERCAAVVDRSAQPLPFLRGFGPTRCSPPRAPTTDRRGPALLLAPDRRYGPPHPTLGGSEFRLALLRTVESRRPDQFHLPS